MIFNVWERDYTQKVFWGMLENLGMCMCKCVSIYESLITFFLWENEIKKIKWKGPKKVFYFFENKREYSFCA